MGEAGKGMGKGDLSEIGGKTLMRAVLADDFDRTAELLSLGADPNWQNQMGSSPLHYAALWGYEDVCFALIEGKANIGLVDETGSTPLHVAASFDHAPERRVQSIKVLLQCGARTDAVNTQGQTPADLAILDEVSIALEEYSQKVLAHNATKLQQLSALDEALSSNAGSIDDFNFFGETALHLAVSSSWKDGITRLLERRANPNVAHQKSNITPLMIAVKKGMMPIVKQLLSAKAEVNAQDRDLAADPRFSSATFEQTPDKHCTALHYASHAGNPGIAQVLVQHMACVNITDSHQCSPLHYCLEQLLEVTEEDNPIKVGSGVRIRSCQGDPNWNGQIGCIFGEKSEEGRWPVYVCCSNKEAFLEDLKMSAFLTQDLIGPLFEDTIKVLLEAKADPCVGNQKVGMERSFLHTAALSGSAALITKALSVGCPVNAKCKGFTALHLVLRSRHDNPEAICILIQAKADLSAKSSPGNNTPLDIALKNRAPVEIVGLLGGAITRGASEQSKARDQVQTVADLSQEQCAMLFLG
eukprot:gnl/MRDRNA2_/MRDRNA2_27307_c0_seq1.p1 gnl/MRDRNA2_/MRDRNA2_27307_c0~~gnl/MRDRNA2_/MRDRNA2_27307_c0_seq1.p1  ORF type:complete len:528 (+),score=87.89 gnl/MRDRNA2_/MRDRNA2_27307_c0_seq1:58-1641(+)